MEVVFVVSKMQLLMRINDGTFSAPYATGQYFKDVLADAQEGSDYDNLDSDGNDESTQISAMDTILPIGIVVGSMALVGSIFVAGAFSSKKREKMKYVLVMGNLCIRMM